MTTIGLVLPAACLLAAVPVGDARVADPKLRLNDKGYFEARGLIDLVGERP